MGAKIVAIASRNRERAEAVAKEFGIEYVAHDWHELIAHKDVDLVSVVTPPSTHMEITLAALVQRKAVLCEKPMALNANEAAKMVEKANTAGVLALIDHELRFLNSRRVMRGMLHTGAIGSVRHCNYVFRSDYRGIPDRAWDWWSDEDMGGGALGASSRSRWRSASPQDYLATWSEEVFRHASRLIEPLVRRECK